MVKRFIVTELDKEQRMVCFKIPYLLAKSP